MSDHDHMLESHYDELASDEMDIGASETHRFGDRNLSIGDIRKMLTGELNPSADIDVSVHGLDSLDLLEKEENQKIHTGSVLDDLYASMNMGENEVQKKIDEKVVVHREAYPQLLNDSHKRLSFYETDDRIACSVEYAANGFFEISKSSTISAYKGMLNSYEKHPRTVHVFGLDPAVIQNAEEVISIIQRSFHNVYLTLGIQPEHVDDNSEKALSEIRYLTEKYSDIVVGIGPVGFNATAEFTDKVEAQTPVAYEQCILAAELGKPLLLTSHGDHTAFIRMCDELELNGNGHFNILFSDPITTQELANYVEKKNFFTCYRPEITYSATEMETYRNVMKKQDPERVLICLGHDRIPPKYKSEQLVHNQPQDFREFLGYVSTLSSRPLTSVQGGGVRAFLKFYEVVK